MYAGEIEDVVSFLIGASCDVGTALASALHSGKVQGPYRKLLPLKSEVDSQLTTAMQEALRDESIFEELCSITRIIPKHSRTGEQSVKIVQRRRKERHRCKKAWEKVYGSPKEKEVVTASLKGKKELPYIFKRRYGKLLVISR